jgi:hypothetical protein
MSSVEEFIEVRNSIEGLARQIMTCLEQNAVQDAKQHLDEGNRQLEELKTMVANDVQVVVAGRLSRHLALLGTKADAMAAKAPVRKPTAGKPRAAKKPAEKKVKAPVRQDDGEVPEIVVFERP